MAEHNNTTIDETNNVILFRAAMKNIFKRVSESVSEEEFANSSPVLEANRPLAEALHDTLVKTLYAGLCKDFEEFMEEGSFVEALGKASKLEEQTTMSSGEKAWRPPGDVDQHLRNLHAEIMKEECGVLEKELGEMQGECERLKEKVIDGRGKVRAIDTKVNRCKKMLPKVVPQLEQQICKLQGLMD